MACSAWGMGSSAGGQATSIEILPAGAHMSLGTDAPGGFAAGTEAAGSPVTPAWKAGARVELFSSHEKYGICRC